MPNIALIRLLIFFLFFLVFPRREKEVIIMNITILSNQRFKLRSLCFGMHTLHQNEAETKHGIYVGYWCDLLKSGLTEYN